MRGRGVYFNRTILDNDNSFARLGWYKWGLPAAILLRKNFLKNSYNFWKGNFWRVPPTYKKQKCETIFGSKLVFAQHAKVVCVLFPFSAHLNQVSQSQIEAESWRLLCKSLTTIFQIFDSFPSRLELWISQKSMSSILQEFYTPCMHLHMQNKFLDMAWIFLLVWNLWCFALWLICNHHLFVWESWG